MRSRQTDLYEMIESVERQEVMDQLQTLVAEYINEIGPARPRVWLGKAATRLQVARETLDHAPGPTLRKMVGEALLYLCAVAQDHGFSLEEALRQTFYTAKSKRGGGAGPVTKAPPGARSVMGVMGPRKDGE